MPRSKREYLRRYADQSMNDLDRAIEKIAQLRNEYIDGTLVSDEEKEVMRNNITDEAWGNYKDYIMAWGGVLQILTQARDFITTLRNNNI